MVTAFFCKRVTTPIEQEQSRSRAEQSRSRAEQSRAGAEQSRSSAGAEQEQSRASGHQASGIRASGHIYFPLEIISIVCYLPNQISIQK